MKYTFLVVKMMTDERRSLFQNQQKFLKVAVSRKELTRSCKALSSSKLKARALAVFTVIP